MRGDQRTGCEGSKGGGELGKVVASDRRDVGASSVDARVPDGSDGRGGEGSVGG